MIINILLVIFSIITISVVTNLYLSSYEHKINHFNKKLNNKPDYKLEVILPVGYSNDTEIKNTERETSKRSLYNSWLKDEIKEYEKVFEGLLKKD